MMSKYLKHGCGLKNRLFNEEVTGQAKEKRSRSLNPMIYPEWWGEEEETFSTMKLKDKQLSPKQMKLQNKRVSDECSLDRRL